MNNKIISVNKIKGKPRYRIVLETGDSFELSTDLILENKIIPNLELDESEIEKLTQKQNIIDAKQTAFNFVSFKPRTTRQVEQKLREKGFSEVSRRSTIEFLVEFGLLNDEEYAMNFIAAYLINKPSGKQKISFELQKKGIDKELINSVLKKSFPDDAVTLAVKSGEKKLRMLTNKDGVKKRNSLITFLQGRGFDWDTIKEALRVLIPE